MVTVKDLQGGKFELSFGATEYLAIRTIATDFGLKRSDVVGSIIHKGFESWRQSIADAKEREQAAASDKVSDTSGG